MACCILQGEVTEDDVEKAVLKLVWNSSQKWFAFIFCRPERLMCKLKVLLAEPKYIFILWRIQKIGPSKDYVKAAGRELHHTYISIQGWRLRHGSFCFLNFLGGVQEIFCMIVG